MPPLRTATDYRNYIRTRTAAWIASKHNPPLPPQPSPKTRKAGN
jgi:hypothetical protein